MDIVILTKRGISFQQIKRGEQTVLFIPSSDGTKVYKDITNTDSIAERYGASNQPPLWRQGEGQTIVYGVLPESLSQRRHAMRVYLAEDFAPPTATAFYYVFGERFVVHGIRETDDEGRRGWRVTLLKAPDKAASKRNSPVVTMVTDSISEQMLEGGEDKACVAVYENLSLYEEFQSALKPLGVVPVPFSTLKVSPRVKPLHKQRDFSMLMLLSVFIALLVLAGAFSFWFVNWLQAGRLSGEIEETRQKILSVQINESIGHIRQPEDILRAMQKTFNQRPSSIMDAAARFGAEFGTLDSVEFEIAADPGDTADRPVNPLNAGEHLLRVNTSTVTNQLLVDQEKLANILMPKAPWVRRVENVPMGRGALTLDMVVQIEEPGANR